MEVALVKKLLLSTHNIVKANMTQDKKQVNKSPVCLRLVLVMFGFTMLSVLAFCFVNHQSSSFRQGEISKLHYPNIIFLMFHAGCSLILQCYQSESLTKFPTNDKLFLKN